jgi:predicted GNAT family acetyltransferase
MDSEVTPPYSPQMTDERWPALPLSEWSDTYATLQRWLQIVGKTRLALTPLVNHWWNATLYLTPSGMTTSTIYTDRLALEVDVDFMDHVLDIRTSDGGTARIALAPKSVATFYGEYLDAFKSVGIDLRIYPVPMELEDVTPFPEDEKHASYDPEYANRAWRILLASARVFNEFRSRFVGKTSPAHFFWGGFDLALTRFSGRSGPVFAGPTLNVPVWVMREGYSRELTSAGFWPGGLFGVEEPVFYSYAYPEPAGYSTAPVEPAETRYDDTMREFILPYEVVRTAPFPETSLLQFLQSTYEAGANAGGWDRAALERGPDVSEEAASPTGLVIKDDTERSRFAADIDGRIPFVEYRRRGNRIYLAHTEVPPALEGRGIGSALAKHALDYARENKLEVVPSCPFIAAYIRSHPTYADLVRVDAA